MQVNAGSVSKFEDLETFMMQHDSEGNATLTRANPVDENSVVNRYGVQYSKYKDFWRLQVSQYMC
jgi:hypothetical protein